MVRWFNSISSEYDNVLREVLTKYVSKKGKSVNKTTSEVALPRAEVGKVCLRFAPEPSGYLRIGHSKATLLNQYSSDSNEFVDNIIKDVETLGINYEKVTYTSDYFSQMMEMAEKLIK
ncbi:hypothetical protein SAY86_019769 [Trapa natans]|uniref:Glutamyl/glutaminyl-tRNA synthetase class Ib catalytic domain-containing protein n=1 Tax=Trapa natans TaxID=22666 RepID=A0AAN7R501_TRANT|nr:hypothetical protein SAY86_019769 [Trapa natans]